MSLGKLARAASLVGEANLIRTLRLYAKTGGADVVVYRNLHCYLARSSVVAVAGTLHLGRRWKKSRFMPSQLVVRDGARLTVNGHFEIYSGCDISVNKGASLILGSGYMSNGVKLDCFDEIRIGEDVAISERVVIRDSDNHLVDGKESDSAPIAIGDHVWIGIGAVILKGVTIGPAPSLPPAPSS